MDLEIPESVGLYVRDGRVRSAVDLLLSAKRPKLPDGLTWPELPEFYRACLAAQQTQVEWALMLEGLWRTIWGDMMTGWNLQPPSQSDVSLAVEDVWDGSFTREYVRGGRQLWPKVECHVDHGLRVGAWLQADGVAKAIEAENLVQHDGWYVSEWVNIQQAATTDVTRLRQCAEHILATIDQ